MQERDYKSRNTDDTSFPRHVITSTPACVTPVALIVKHKIVEEKGMQERGCESGNINDISFPRNVVTSNLASLDPVPSSTQDNILDNTTKASSLLTGNDLLPHDFNLIIAMIEMHN